MILYKNLGQISKVYYGVTWRPNEERESPGYINDASFLRIHSTQTAQYVIRFKTHDGKIISSRTYAVGQIPDTPEDPSRKSSNMYSYTFAGWQPDIVPVSADAEYTATYIRTNLRSSKQLEK